MSASASLPGNSALSGTQPLPYTDDVKARTDHLYPRVKKVIPPFEWRQHAPYIDAVNTLKKQKNAVILVHNYMTPEIFNCVGDFCGDSLQLAQEAARTDAAVIVQAGVRFMAETSKILSPEKTVLIPDVQAGCSLAESITPEDVRLLKRKYKGVPVVSYVNTNADVKAESDICCTSSNAVAIVEHAARAYGTGTVIMLPDRFLAENVSTMTKVKIVTWAGSCEVHERFTANDIDALRKNHPGITVLAHPECPADVLEKADFAGSTSSMSHYVRDRQPRNVVLVTECSMSDNVAVENPDVEFIRPCNLCPHMKRISLPKILHSLETLSSRIEIDPGLAARARLPVERMLAVSSAKPAAYDRLHAPAVHAVEARA